MSARCTADYRGGAWSCPPPCSAWGMQQGVCPGGGWQPGGQGGGLAGCGAAAAGRSRCPVGWPHRGRLPAAEVPAGSAGGPRWPGSGAPSGAAGCLQPLAPLSAWSRPARPQGPAVTLAVSAGIAVSAAWQLCAHTAEALLAAGPGPLASAAARPLCRRPHCWLRAACAHSPAAGCRSNYASTVAAAGAGAKWLRCHAS
jgi:hypothetical protein